MPSHLAETGEANTGRDSVRPGSDLNLPYAQSTLRGPLAPYLTPLNDAYRQPRMGVSDVRGAIPRSTGPAPSRSIAGMPHSNERVTTALSHPVPHISDFAARRGCRCREDEDHLSDREYDRVGGQRHPYESGVTHRDEHRVSHGDIYGQGRVREDPGRLSPSHRGAMRSGVPVGDRAPGRDFREVSFHPSHDARPYQHEPRSDWRTGNREYRCFSHEAPLDNREWESNDREFGRYYADTRSEANYSRGREREPVHPSEFWSQSRSYALAPVQDALRKLGLRFNGVERADSFLRRVLEARSMFPDSDVEILRSISFFLTDRALEWYHAKRTSWRDLGDFTAAFKRRFLRAASRVTIINEIMRRTQGGDEPVLELLTCIQALSQKASPPLPERELIEYAHRNLLPRIQHAIPYYDIADFDHLKDLAADIEQRQVNIKSFTPPPTPERSYYAELAYRPPRYAKSGRTTRPARAELNLASEEGEEVEETDLPDNREDSVERAFAAKVTISNRSKPRPATPARVSPAASKEATVVPPPPYRRGSCRQVLVGRRTQLAMMRTSE